MGKKPMKPPQANKPSAAQSQPAGKPTNNDDDAVASPSTRGRKGAPPAASTAASSPTSGKIDLPSALLSSTDTTSTVASVTAVCPLFNQCPSNKVEMPASLMKKLKLVDGALCLLRSIATGVELPLVCVPARDVAAPNVAVSVETLHLLGERECEAKRLEGARVRELEGQTEALILHPIPTDTAESSAVCVTSMQLAAGCVSTFERSIVFDRMVTVLILATNKVRVRVEFSRSTKESRRVEEGPAGLDFGRVTPLSVVRTTAINGVEISEAESDNDEEEPTPSAGNSLVSTLFVGAAGLGKTHRLTSLVRSLPQSTTVITMDAQSLSTCGSAAAVSRVRETLALASALPKSVVVVDNLDVACAGTSIRESDEARFHAQLVSQIFSAGLTAHPSIVMIASAEDDTTLDPTLKRHFTQVVKCEAPASAAERLDILRHLVKSHADSGTVSDGCVAILSERTFGFVPHDLASLVHLAASIGFERFSRFTVTDETLSEAHKLIRPSAIRNFEISIPNVRWTDIGGSEEAKRVLQDCVAWSLGHQHDLFQRLGLNPPRGVLLYGPPGCSKTMLAKALACESKLNFISVKGPEVFSKWVGDSEKAVREIFSKARAVAPCVVFIDELDGMCGKRGNGGVSDRVISQFLTELDGLPSAVSGKPDDVVFVAATNRPDNIDAAVMRPGRIDRKVYVGLPSESERCAIANLGLRGVPVDADVSAEAIAKATAGYTGAEVIAVCKEAALQAIIESEDATMVCSRHVTLALRRVPPRVSRQDVDWYMTWGRT